MTVTAYARVVTFVRKNWAKLRREMRKSRNEIDVTGVRLESHNNVDHLDVLIEMLW